MTANAAPSDIPQLEERLISRFSSGLVTRIEPPEFETRVAIVHQKAKLHGFQLSENIAAFLAARVDGNIRELEGALTRIHSLHVLQQLPITLDLAKIAIGIDDGEHQDHQPRVSRTSWMRSATITTQIDGFAFSPAQISRHAATTWNVVGQRYTRYSLEEIGHTSGVATTPL